jgi:hypothetical protein
MPALRDASPPLQRTAIMLGEGKTQKSPGVSAGAK